MTPEQLTEVEAAALSEMEGVQYPQYAIAHVRACDIQALVAEVRWMEEALASKYMTSVPDHLNHMTDGRWHDTCGYCIRRRTKGGTGIAELDEAKAENVKLRVHLKAMLAIVPCGHQSDDLITRRIASAGIHEARDMKAILAARAALGGAPEGGSR